MPWHRGWFSHERFLVIHLNRMSQLESEGLVERDGVALVEAREDNGELLALSLEGRILCLGHVAVRVDQSMAVRRGPSNRYEVRTVFVQYHAWIRPGAVGPRRNLVRYDNAHSSQLHKHIFDQYGKESRPSLPIDFADLPSLEAFIREAVAIAEAR